MDATAAAADDVDAMACNPLCYLPGYADSVLDACPSLVQLDGLPAAASRSRVVPPPAAAASAPSVTGAATGKVRPPIAPCHCTLRCRVLRLVLEP